MNADCGFCVRVRDMGRERKEKEGIFFAFGAFGDVGSHDTICGAFATMYCIVLYRVSR